MTPPDPLPSEPAINATRGVLVLVAINVAVHAVRWLLPSPLDDELVLWLGFAPSLYVPLGDAIPYLGATGLLRPLTYAFLHGDLIHLLLNMAFLLAFGTAVERRLGTGRFITLYLLCVLLAPLGTVAVYLYTLSPVLVIGASGGVAGLFGAVGHFLFRRAASPLLGDAPARRATPAIAYIAAFVLLNLILAFTGWDLGGGIRAVAWEAHIAGFLAGYLLYPVLKRI